MPAPHFTRLMDAERAERRIVEALVQVMNLQGMDAEAMRQPGTEFTALTKVGTVRGKVIRGSTIRRGLHLPPWVYFQFQDVDNAVAYYGRAPYGRLNPHSGKWNHMFGVDSFDSDLATLVVGLSEIEPRNFKVIGMN